MKYLAVGILPADNRNYRVEPCGLVHGDRLPLLYAITSAMDMGGHLVIQHQIPLKHIVEGVPKPVFQWYAVFLGKKNYRVLTESEFRQFFNRPGAYKPLKVRDDRPYIVH